MVKECSKCGATKPADQFPRGRVCRACVYEAQNLRYAKRQGSEQQYSLTQRNAALSLLGQRECKACGEVKPLDGYRLKDGRRARCCLACVNARLREAYSANANGIRDRLVAHGKKRRERHGPRLNDQKREYVARNRAKVTQRQNEWLKARVRSDPVFALKKRIRSLIGNAFANAGCQKNKETLAILGCTWDEFRAHIERQFTKGMSWERMGREIHIDHIRPLATAKSQDDVLALNHYTNLRPMWARENIAKGAKVLSLV